MTTPAKKKVPTDFEAIRQHLQQLSKARGLTHSRLGIPIVIRDCHDCGAKPGEVHVDGCDMEHCSVCGFPRLGCGCKGHDKAFARWTGFWVAELESEALGIDLNDFYRYGFNRIFFVKPNHSACKAASSQLKGLSEVGRKNVTPLNASTSLLPGRKR